MTSVWRQVASHQATCAIILQSKVVPQWLRTLDTHLLASHCIKKKMKCNHPATTKFSKSYVFCDYFFSILICSNVAIKKSLTSVINIHWQYGVGGSHFSVLLYG